MFAKIAYPQSTIIFRQDMQRAARWCWRRWCERDHEIMRRRVSYNFIHKYLIKPLSTQSALLRCKQEIDIKKWNFSFFLFPLYIFFRRRRRRRLVCRASIVVVVSSQLLPLLRTRLFCIKYSFSIFLFTPLPPLACFFFIFRSLSDFGPHSMPSKRKVPMISSNNNSIYSVFATAYTTQSKQKRANFFLFFLSAS